jgi:hypothetical protein
MAIISNMSSDLSEKPQYKVESTSRASASSGFEKIESYLDKGESDSQIDTTRSSLKGRIATISSTSEDPYFKEKSELEEFVREKSQKFGIKCVLRNHSAESFMSAIPIVGSGGGRIEINPLYFLGKEQVNRLYERVPAHKKSVEKFLLELNKRLLNQAADPGLLAEAADDLIDLYNSSVAPEHRVGKNSDTRLIAKEILIMDARGELASFKRFTLMHELGHIYDYTKSLSMYKLDKFSTFIQPSQYAELRADLFAARELQAHDKGASFFDIHSIIAKQPLGLEHPNDSNRAKALRLDAQKPKPPQKLRNESAKQESAS